MDGLSAIGIDLWGMFLYLVNYGILLGILGYYFYPMIIKTIDKRRETIKQNIEETQRLQEELEKKLQAQVGQADKMKAEYKAEAAAMKKELADKRTEMIAEMEEERAKMMDEAKELLKQKRDAIVADAEKQVLSTMKKVLLSVMQNRVPEDAVESSVSDAWNKYKKM